MQLDLFVTKHLDKSISRGYETYIRFNLGQINPSWNDIIAQVFFCTYSQCTDRNFVSNIIKGTNICIQLYQVTQRVFKNNIRLKNYEKEIKDFFYTYPTIVSEMRGLHIYKIEKGIVENYINPEMNLYIYIPKTPEINTREKAKSLLLSAIDNKIILEMVVTSYHNKYRRIQADNIFFFPICVSMQFPDLFSIVNEDRTIVLTDKDMYFDTAKYVPINSAIDIFSEQLRKKIPTSIKIYAQSVYGEVKEI